MDKKPTTKLSMHISVQLNRIDSIMVKTTDYYQNDRVW